MDYHLEDLHLRSKFVVATRLSRTTGGRDWQIEKEFKHLRYAEDAYEVACQVAETQVANTMTTLTDVEVALFELSATGRHRLELRELPHQYHKYSKK